MSQPPNNGGFPDQYPLHDTHFSEQQPMSRAPNFAADPYPDHPEDFRAYGGGDYMAEPLLQTNPVGPPVGVPPAFDAYGNQAQAQPGVRFQAPPSPGPHYGEAPRRQPRRYKTTRRVELVGGNLVLDCPVPTKYLQAVPRKDEKEFTHMRYTAATCDPSDFSKENYTLRPALLGRSTELFIVMTMYNVSTVDSHNF
ncbi:chitin synthase N-terminal-domain-containing protein, partial [Jimgerdemannia flammicorona]